MLVRFILSIVALLVSLFVPTIYGKATSFFKKTDIKSFGFGIVIYLLVKLLLVNPITNLFSLLGYNIASVVISIICEILEIIVSYKIMIRKRVDRMSFFFGYMMIFITVNITVPLLKNVSYVFQVWKNGVSYYENVEAIESITNMSNGVYLAIICLVILSVICLKKCFISGNVLLNAVVITMCLKLYGLYRGIPVIITLALYCITNWFIKKGNK